MMCENQTSFPGLLRQTLCSVYSKYRNKIFDLFLRCTAAQTGQGRRGQDTGCPTYFPRYLTVFCICRYEIYIFRSMCQSNAHTVAASGTRVPISRRQCHCVLLRSSHSQPKSERYYASGTGLASDREQDQSL